jgi:hypothetical protein
MIQLDDFDQAIYLRHFYVSFSDRETSQGHRCCICINARTTHTQFVPFTGVRSYCVFRLYQTLLGLLWAWDQVYGSPPNVAVCKPEEASCSTMSQASSSLDSYCWVGLWHDYKPHFSSLPALTLTSTPYTRNVLRWYRAVQKCMRCVYLLRR